MEISCTRCHQAVLAENCFCPHCGLPQLTYETEGVAGQERPQRFSDGVQDASSVAWKPALRAAILLAVPAGILSSGVSPLGFLGLVWMAIGAAWAVALYMRSQRPAWITIGAGARIGLVTGLLAGWLAFGVSGGALFVQRFVLHQASQIDGNWKDRVALSQQMTQQWMANVGPADASQAQAAQAQVQAWMLSPWGHAGLEAFGFATNTLLLIFFATSGGAIGARFLGRTRQPEV